jgi:hypothetical protein
LILLEIVSHDDGEDDLGQVNEYDQPFGLSPGYMSNKSFWFWLGPTKDPTKLYILCWQPGFNI